MVTMKPLGGKNPDGSIASKDPLLMKLLGGKNPDGGMESKDPLLISGRPN